MSKVVKPPFTMSIVQVKAGYTIPEALLSKLSSENPSAFGMVVRTKKSMDVETFAGDNMRDTPEERLEFLKEINQNTKDFWRMFCFSNYQNDFDESETQPIVIIKDKKTGDPELVIAVEGDFPKYTENAEGWSEPFNLIDTWLGPKIEDMYKLVGGTNQKVFDWLSGQQFHRDFEDQIGHRGSIGVMPLVGLPFIVEKNELGGQYDWGQCSNVYGYTEAVQNSGTPAAEPVSSKKTSKYASGKTENPTPPTPASSGPVNDKKPDPVAAAAAQFTETTEDRKPPENLHGKALKQWYRKMSGDLPTNWAERPAVKVKVRRSVTGGTTHEETMTSAAALMNKSPVGETLPIISKEELASANEFIKKHLGDGSAIIDDPVKAAEDEAKLSTFSELHATAGIKNIRDVLRLRTSFIFALAQNHPKDFALAFIDLRNAYGQLVEAGDKQVKELAGKATTTTEPTKATGTDGAPAPRRSKYASG